MKKLMVTMIGVALAAGSARAAETKVDFAKEIVPILEKNCFKCHGAKKKKGKLRLDSQEAALKGGKGGPALVAGDPAKSELYVRVTLPPDDDDIMPSEGDPLTKAQQELIRKWIAEGADWPEGAIVLVDDAKKGPPGPPLPENFKPSAAEQKAVANLAKQGIDLRPIAMKMNWREANLRLHGTNVTDKTLASFKPILSLVNLNLAKTKITDAGLANIKGLTNLQRLHLELTPITDAGLAHLKQLPNLTYLNLYGTKVTDSGLEQLAGLKYLRNLYVWQTEVTDAGVKKLKEALPDVDVSTGWDVAAFVKIAEEAAKARAEREAAEKKRKEEEKKKKEEEKKKKEAEEKAAKEKAEKEKAAKAEDKDKKPAAEKDKDKDKD
jgi:mono/diheme cytochrome c family protein